MRISLALRYRGGIRSEDQITILRTDEIQQGFEIFAQGSRKLRYLLFAVAELVGLGQNKKLLIFVTLSAQQTWLECVSQISLRSKVKGC